MTNTDTDTDMECDVDLGPVDVDAVRDQITGIGYAIVAGVVPVETVRDMRAFWLNAFATRASKAPLIWGPHLGEENRILFHRVENACLFRAYDFLWNDPIHAATRDIGIHLNRIRNRIAELPPLSGETFSADRYGVYLTTSYYPPGEGWMAEHVDRTDGRRHWHFILPLTFKGEDFSDGGLFLGDRGGGRVEVDERMRPGSVIFYDGTLAHGVERVVSNLRPPVGRLQMFSIPTFMDRPQDNDRMAETVSLARFVKGKMRPLKHRLLGLRAAAPDRDFFS